ncbi:hypothetical protein G6F37_004268 [Rhizopus arrhizus]|nr:hypothetical protein G6F38_005289 [Rhizopus arrhizus]KAG1160141.1 hypothetical protein G6F37_004268 [Rhizopus arrhizus]
MKSISFIVFGVFSTLALAQNTTYPVSGKVPTPKAEWLDLIKNATITPAPVLKSNGNDGPSTSGEDKYCDWAKSGCTGSSLYDCPKGQWGLTFDDGPSTFSPSLYDFLKQTNQKATLFMIGANVVQHPEIVKRAYDEGHEIAIHTWSHPYLTTLTNEQVVAELKWTELAIKEIIGVSPRLFRPPYGDIDNRVRDIGTALGFTSVIWDHDTNDWMLAENAAGFKSEFIDGNFTEWVKEANTSSTGGLSLEHDITQVTINVAIKNLPALQKAYEVVTVGQCSGVSSYKESNTTVSVNTTTAANVTTASSTTISISVTPVATPLASNVAAADGSLSPNKAAASTTSSASTVTSSHVLLLLSVAIFVSLA